jgi:HD-GYP domain-containing protein (c-di-GMP phosphodiesterase class II)
LEWAGLLHDIGKIGIVDAVLSKPGRLTADEFDHIKTHPAQSAQVLQPVDGLRANLPIVRHHHEHNDGSGYPDGLVGEEIPLLARIIQVADTWDAITSSRSYRKAIPFDKALGIMREEAGIITDASVAHVLIDMVQQDDFAHHNESSPIAPR